MNDTIAIRVATPADLGAVDALLARAFPRLLARDYPPSVRVLALPLIARARPELLATGTYYLAEAADGRILGAGGWTASTPTFGNVRQFVTDDRHVRRGIGGGIMRRVISEAAAAGLIALDCLATRTAVPFYAAMGFHAVGAVTVPLRPGIEFPAIRMQRRL